ncbi:hypothetical protein F2P56_001144 [Juglans regia]|uniref:Uncharacterized mitochondrial protein AtMg00860-like n=2 Tax=Juglans regia TaxID=51240 RepID=A0A2I4FG76_JUGRE|nr:uncharacterized mitochondrial protein AtMg00860-like [Juglans regia]KAF5480389.1 hypothetical protein F2P56_001144 [Juglans regia]
MEEHVGHLREVLNMLKQHCMFAKKSKCRFAVNEVDYLGHIINDKGVMGDPSKVVSMVEWPEPKNVKALRGFLGLTGYYQKFIQNYDLIAAPLTSLLKKNDFSWNPEASKAFTALKQAMSHPPILKLPNFSKPFVIECDASGNGIGQC